VPNICFFLPLCIIFANISTPSRSKLVPQTFLHCPRPKSAKKVAKRCNKGEKKQMFSTGLNLALELHLVQSLIYPGATFSMVPAKRYECPSMSKLPWLFFWPKNKISIQFIECIHLRLFLTAVVAVSKIQAALKSSK